MRVRSAIAVLLLLLAAHSAAAQRLKYPESPVRPVADTLHGTVVTDPYRWLEDGSSAATQSWTRKQNALTAQYVGAYPGRAGLRKRLEALYAIPGRYSPTVRAGHYFQWRRDGLQDHGVLYASDGRLGAARRALLDPNTFSKDGTVALDWWELSPDASLLAYGKSASGDEQSTLYVRDVRSGKDLAEAIPRTRNASVCWDPDGSGFVYGRHPAKGDVPAGEEVFHNRIFHHRLGNDWHDDSLVTGDEGRPIQEWRQATHSSDFAWQFLFTSLDWAKNDLYIRRSGGLDPFRPVAVGQDGAVGGDVYGGKLYLRTNINAPRYHIVVTDPEHPEPAGWKEVVSEVAGVIESMDIIGGKLVLNTSEAAISHLFVYALDGHMDREIDLPTIGVASGISGEPGGNEMFFTFQSFTYPSTVFRYDMVSGALAKVDSVDPGYDVNDYVTKLVWTRSKDSTYVPMFLVHRKDIPVDGNRPVILDGYGGFEIKNGPYFAPAFIPFMEKGGVFVETCLRGGGEFGRSWHEAGRLARKQNVFDDFYACAEYLVQKGLTKPSRITASGGSNGGLLVGAAITQRPQLFGAALCGVPLLDMLRYQDFLIGRYWVPEYGSAEDSAQFRFLLKYSPYQNVKPGTCFPATLFTCGESDSRVDPLHARKMTALVQATTTCDAPILVRVETKAGHGQGKPTSKKIDEHLDEMSFVFLRMGM